MKKRAILVAICCLFLASFVGLLHTYFPGGQIWHRFTDYGTAAFSRERAAWLAARDIATVLIFAPIIAIVGFAAYSFPKARGIRKNVELSNYNALRRVFHSAIAGLIYLKDENLNYLLISKGMEKFFQRREEEIIGQDDYALFPAEVADQIRKTDLTVLQKRTLAVDQLEQGDKVVKVTKFPVRLSTGNYGVGGCIQDITAEYKKQRQEEKKLLRNAILADILRRDFPSASEQFSYALRKALKLTESKYGFFYLYDEETRRFKLSSWAGETGDHLRSEGKEYHLEGTALWENIVGRRKPRYINDCRNSALVKEAFPAGSIPFTRLLAVPVLSGGKVAAVLALADKEKDYDQDDVHQVAVLMKGLWQAKEKREAAEKLALERKKYFLTLLSIGDGVMVVDRKGKIEILNEAAQRLTGWSACEALGRHYREVFVLAHEEEGQLVKDPIAAVFATNKIQNLTSRAVLVSREGKKYYLEDSAAPIKDSKGETIGAVLVFRDVTAEREQRKQIEYLSFHDPLTGLYNRRYIEAKLRECDTRENLPLSVIVGDVNSLKLANDIFGHKYGDELLQKIASALSEVLRSDDIIARWGGDEFLVLLPRTGPRETERIISRIKTRLSQEHVRSIQASVSLGYATKMKMEDDIEQVVMNAEDVMYTEKTLDRAKINRRMLGVLLTTFHERSPREKEHAQRVSQLCRNMGVKLGLPAEEIERLAEAGYFHDLGKTVLEDEVLNKVGLLTELEWNQVKRHSVVGCRILKLFDQTLELAGIVLSHHERWDGEGYPQGLKGEEIPRLTRIITLAEAYDAMTTGFYSGKPLDKGEALAIIEKGAGSQFDPALVPVFRQLVSEG